jgi:hypothetical protein
VSEVGGVRPEPLRNDAGNSGSPPTPLLDKVRAWRFPPLETYPDLVAFAQTLPGKVVLLILFALLLHRLSSLWFPITIAAGACAYAGQYRSRVVTLATLCVLLLSRGWIDWTPATLVAAVEGVAPQIVPQLNGAALAVFFVFSAAALYCVRRWSRRPILRRPIVCLHAAFILMLVLGASGLLHGMPRVALWSCITTLGAYFWFLCYALKDIRAKDASPIWAQLGVFHPFWGSTTAPLGKGMAYLRRVEAKNPLDLALSQLKGLKLLMWVGVLEVISLCMKLVAVGLLHTPPLDEALAQYMARHSYPGNICRASVLYTFFQGMLDYAVFGDTYVACARMAGYPILRNSCRPLSSKTLADFWNRYYYYFKELLVEVFFFPTFLRYFKSNTRLRLFVATFMAAGVGNFIFHFIREIRTVPQAGLLKTVVGFQSYAFYCTVLAIAIGLSQMRKQRTAHRHHGWVRRQALPSLMVILFYCVLEVFGWYPYSPYSLWAHFSFLFHCFGVDGWI